MKIYVADDSAAIQKVVRLAFSGLPFEIHDAESLISLGSMIQHFRPDLVLADPKLTGIGTPNDLHNVVQNIPVVLLVGSYDSIDEEEWKNAGFPVQLKKPFGGKALIDLVQSLVPALSAHQLPESLRLDHKTSSSFSGSEPTMTNRMASAPSKPENTSQISLELDLLPSSEDLEMTPDIPIIQPLTQTMDKGKKAFQPSISSLDDELGLAEIVPPKQNVLGVLEQNLKQSPPPSRDSMIGVPEAAKTPISGLTAPNLKPASRTSPSATDVALETRGKDESLSAGSVSAANLAQMIDPDKILAQLWPRIHDLVRNEVRQYLDVHLKSQLPALTKEVIMQEIRRLSEEKARINIDK
jgi:CheY-like chemotaxis protein